MAVVEGVIVLGWIVILFGWLCDFLAKRGHMAELENAKWPRQIIFAAVTGVLIAVTEYFGHMFLPSFFYTPWFSMWFVVGSGVLFGFWGVLAVYFGHAIAYIPIWGRDLAVLLSFGAFFQALISAWAFRQFKGDPRLKDVKDFFLFLVFGVFLGSLASTLIGPAMMYFFGVVPNMEALTKVVMPAWFLSTSIFTLLFGFPLLLLGSRIVIKARAYCKGWFS